MCEQFPLVGAKLFIKRFLAAPTRPSLRISISSTFETPTFMMQVSNCTNVLKIVLFTRLRAKCWITTCLHTCKQAIDNTCDRVYIGSFIVRRHLWAIQCVPICMAAVNFPSYFMFYIRNVYCVLKLERHAVGTSIYIYLSISECKTVSALQLAGPDGHQTEKTARKANARTLTHTQTTHFCRLLIYWFDSVQFAAR